MNENQKILKQYWGYDTFRPMQEEIIQSVMDGKDTLALLPTGGGKSICFQVPGLMMEGVTLVISPLIALMKDQVEQLKKRKIPAAAIYSGMANRAVDILLDNCVHGQVKFLYVSPERLKSELFLARVKLMQVAMLAIDEAHCISQWGYDFRPSYTEIADLYEFIPNTKKIALTATATRDVKRDICDKLLFEEPAIFQKSFARDNLSYSVFNLENKGDKILEILKNVGGSAIVYVRSRKETQNVAKWLYANGISADFYHAGLDTQSRSKKQEEWIKNRRRVMVSTNAFGMGIDKPDVRVVVHFGLPDSMEAYYQEAGRAGRDERKAYAVMLVNEPDLLQLKKQVTQRSPDLDFIKRVYQAIANYYKLAIGSSELESFDLDLVRFVDVYQLPSYETYYAIKKLEEMGLVLLNESLGKSSSLKLNIPHDELYKYMISNAKMEPLLKALLRLYGGNLYNEFVNISEFDLAKVSKSNQSDTTKKLEFLHQNDIATYNPIRKVPQLTYLTPRLNPDGLGVYYAKIKERNKVTHDQVEAIMAYAKNTHLCRTRLFQEYFDEEAYLNCGVCDVCVKAKKEETFEANKETLIHSILTSLEAESQSIIQLKDEFSANDDFLFTETIRELLDQGKIVFESTEMLRLG